MFFYNPFSLYTIYLYLLLVLLTALATKESIKRVLTGTAVKHSPWAYKGVRSPIIGVPNPDGTLELVGGGYGMAPDTLGYINNNVKQLERKSIIKARLQQKLLQKQIKG